MPAPIQCRDVKCQEVATATDRGGGAQSNQFGGWTGKSTRTSRDHHFDITFLDDTRGKIFFFIYNIDL